MKKPSRIFSLLLFLFFVLAASWANGFELLGEAGEWKISGADGQCQAVKPLESSIPSQFAIGISAQGTYLTFQNLKWSLPSTARNTMPVKVFLDDSLVLKTEALLINQVWAFQVFVWLTKVPDDVFWEKFLNARIMKVTGKFKPGEAKTELKNTAEIVPLLTNCAQRYLPGVRLPFKISE